MFLGRGSFHNMQKPKIQHRVPMEINLNPSESNWAALREKVRNALSRAAPALLLV